MTELHAVEDKWTLHLSGPDPDGQYIAEIRRNGKYVTVKCADTRVSAIDRGRAWMDFYRSNAEAEVIEL